MRGADTNVIVRYIIGDIEHQMELVDRYLKDGEQFFINESVLTELTWVLTVSYNFTKQELIETYDFLLESSGFAFFNAAVVTRALAQFIRSSAGFNDCLVNELNRNRGFDTLTFDKKAAKLPGMKLLN